MPDGARTRTVVIGAGPAGLTAAYQLGKRDLPVEVFEADTVVGGISRTVERDGWRFDLGGHRFFTKVPLVRTLWREILPAEDFMTRPRMSRIYYRGKLFDYPLRAMNALRGLGIVEALRCVLSYMWAQLDPPMDQTHFEGWVTARFGKRLYSIFFKTYTEKVWGLPATEIQADWAAQRIKNLSLFKAVVNAIMPRRKQTAVVSLIEEFQYPRLGPGMMWERCAQLVTKQGGVVTMETTVTHVHRDSAGVIAVTVSGPDGVRRVEADHLISSMPMQALVRAMEPGAPGDVVAAADDLRYRDFLTVALVVPLEFSFPDNWIYIHEPGVNVGRIQNFGSWSPFMVKAGRTCLGLEFFVNEGDELWSLSDEELVALATAELEQLGLVRPGAVEAGYAVRVRKAYPVYDERYQDNVDTIRSWLSRAVPNVHPVGRNGMHRYNNQDHAMMTALLTAANIKAGWRQFDVWRVNEDAEYLEETRPSSGATGLREVPARIRPTGTDD
jgi:protoporphyrinogen oxidase